MAEFDFSEAISQARAKYGSIAEALDMDRLKAQIAELEQQAAEPGLWDDPENAQKVTSRLSAAQSQLKRLNSASQRIDDVETLVELGQEEEDADALAEAQEEVKKIQSDLDDMEIQTLLDGEYDERSAVVTIRSGAGGVDEGVGSFYAFDGPERLRRIRNSKAVDLGGIKHVGRPRHTALAVVVAIVGIGVGLVLLVEDDERRLLALADLRSKLGPLAIRGPDWSRIAEAFGGNPEAHDIDAVIELLGQRILRHEQRCCRTAPRQRWTTGIGLNGSDELGGDFGVDVAAFGARFR